jgi:hypothetical protein
MFVELTVPVPDDRIQAFQLALGAFSAARDMPTPDGGSSVSSWRDVAAQIEGTRVVDFYEAFADWLAKAKAATPVATPMSAAELTTVFPHLPRMEREMLHLLADDSGRAVGWLELKSKFCLAGKPSLVRAFPHLAAKCEALACAIPIEQAGTGDDTVFVLPIDFVRVVARI